MKTEKIVTLLLIGFGVIGIAWYLTHRKASAAPGAGGILGTAGGAAITRAVRDHSAGVSGSIPNIIASAAALTGQSFGQVVVENLPHQNVATTDVPLSTTLIDPPSGATTLPGLHSPNPDISSNVSALDVGGIDYGSFAF